MQRRRYMSLIVLVSILFVVTTVAFAGKRQPPPFATLTTQWTPDEQLASISGDTRTVSLKMSVTIDRQFWAMDMSCALSQPDLFETSGQTMTWDNSWKKDVEGGMSGTNYFDTTLDVSGVYYVQGTGEEPDRINASITRVGAANPPVGYNGTTYTQELFTLELTVADTLTGIVQTELTCDKIAFLNRDGESVGGEDDVIAVNQSNTLTLREGYRISGTALRQAAEDQTQMNVQCEHIATNHLYDTNTEAEVELDNRGRVIGEIPGIFKFEQDLNGTDPLRDYGLYECTFISKLGGTEDQLFLRGRSYINLQTPDYQLQPIVVPAGDTDGNNDITVDDFVLITGNWEDTGAPYIPGDVNGDGVVDQVDLTITASNVGLSDTDGGVMMDHVLYSVARDYNGTFPNNTLNMGSIFSGQVTNLNTNRAFWPQVSPDGASIAYSGESFYFVDRRGNRTDIEKRAAGTVSEEGIFISDINGNNAISIAQGKAFAPSWSPSGGRIAYICSWEGDEQGYNEDNQDLLSYSLNNGNLCITSPTGNGTRTIIPSGALSTYAKVFPPAWYDDNTILYAGNSLNTICPDQICYYNLLTNTHGLVDIEGIDGTGNNASMPVIIRYSDTLTYLYYRYFTSSDTSELRMGPIEYDAINDSWTNTGLLANFVDTNYQHETVDGTEGGVHYYDVSPMLDVMFYEFGDYQFTNLIFNDAGTEYEWSEADSHMVDGFIGYPMLDTFANTVWDGYDEELSPTDFHAYRATIDWLP